LNNIYPVEIADVYFGNKLNAREEKSKGTKGVIIKAGQGGYTSLPFDFIYQCNKVNLPYGIYWVIDSRYSAEYHINEIKKSLSSKDFGKLGMWWDLEKPVWTMSDVDYYKTPYAGNSLIESITDAFYSWCGKTGGAYTSPGFAKLLGWNTDKFKSSPFANKLSRMPLWIAQYNSSITKPDLFGNWKNWTLWQYMAEPDYNYYNGTLEDFNKRFGINEESEVPEISEDLLLSSKKYYDGAILNSYQADLPQGKTKYYVFEIDMAKADFFVSPQLLSRMYVPKFIEKYNLDIAINGDGFVSTTIAGFASSEGIQYGKRGIEETLYINKENKISREFSNPIWNAVSYPNRLIVDGKVTQINKSRDDIRGRSSIGYNKEQTKMFIFACDGKDYYSKDGMNFWEVAERMADLGCDYAVMLDGGGSTTLSVRSENKALVIGVPCGEDSVVGYEYPMRRVANVFGVRMKTEPEPDPIPEGIPEGGNMKYKVVKSARFRSIASTTTNDTGASSVVGDIFESTVTKTDINNSAIVMVQHTNGKWLPLSIGTVIYTEEVIGTTPVEDEIIVRKLEVNVTTGKIRIDGGVWI
jgi:hypothetical protein